MRIARESWPFVLALAGICLVVGVALHPAAAILPGLLLLFTLWFFRDPDRVVPADTDALISPADGKIIKAGPERLSIFLNIFNVHVCRAPTPGVVQSVEHTPGRFLAAFKDEASEQNERTAILLDDGRRQVCFTLVAGLVARRIVCRLAPGQQVAAGDRVGLIRFGSRVDVDLPAGAQVTVQVGQKVVAGETILARLV